MAWTKHEDAMDLAIAVLGVEDIPYGDMDRLEYELEKRFGVGDLDLFTDIANELLRYTYPIESPLSGEMMHTFGFEDSRGVWNALMRTRVGGG